jgi:hypothetical protein
MWEYLYWTYERCLRLTVIGQMVALSADEGAMNRLGAATGCTPICRLAGGYMGGAMGLLLVV